MLSPMATPTSVNSQITDAVASPVGARAELRYVLSKSASMSVELGWGLQDETARVHVTLIDHELPCPFVPSGTRLPLSFSDSVDLGGADGAKTIASWLHGVLESDAPATARPPSKAATTFSVAHANNTVSLVWEPAEAPEQPSDADSDDEPNEDAEQLQGPQPSLKLELRCIELPVHVYNDGFSGQTCRVSASFELPFARADAEQLARWLDALAAAPN